MARMLGEVDLLGLDAFALSNFRSQSLIGAGLGATAAAIGRGVAKPGQGAKVGLAAGLGASLVMAFVPKTRDMAAGSVVGALIAGGAVEFVVGKVLGLFGFGSSGAVAGLGLPSVNYLNGNLGLPEVSWEAPVYGANLGLPTIAPEPPAYGVWNKSPMNGVAGPQFGAPVPPVDLLGQPTAQSQQLELMGGPTISGLSASYGATLFGPNS